MKKLLLASAVAALSITAAQAAPTVYGKVFLSLDIQDGNDVAKAAGLDTRSQLNSNASRLGVKGSEALTANTDVVYQLEYRLDTDASGQRNWEARDTYLGLAHKELGTLVGGRLTAIDDYINYAKVVQGGVVGGDDVLAGWTGPRANNAFAYFSPNYNGAQFMGMYALDENGSADNLSGDAFGVGVKYEPENSPIKAGLTYIKASQFGHLNAASADLDADEKIVTNGGKFQTVRASVAYALNPVVTVAGQYQFSDYNSNKDENSFTVSGSYKVAQTPWTAYAQADVVDNFKGISNYDKQRLAVGGKYAFNKNTTGHLYGAYMKTELNNVDAKSYGAGAGLEYKF